jgi:hypothetical protein
VPKNILASTPSACFSSAIAHGDSPNEQEDDSKTRDKVPDHAPHARPRRHALFSFTATNTENFL